MEGDPKLLAKMLADYYDQPQPNMCIINCGFEHCDNEYIIEVLFCIYKEFITQYPKLLDNSVESLAQLKVYFLSLGFLFERNVRTDERNVRTDERNVTSDIPFATLRLTRSTVRDVLDEYDESGHYNPVNQLAKVWQLFRTEHHPIFILKRMRKIIEEKEKETKSASDLEIPESFEKLFSDIVYLKNLVCVHQTPQHKYILTWQKVNLHVQGHLN